MAEWFFRKKSKGEVERDPGWDEYFTSNRSMPFNPLIAAAFYHARYIEHVGSGIEDIEVACAEAGLPQTTVDVRNRTIVHTIWRKTTKETVGTTKEISLTTKEIPLSLRVHLEGFSDVHGPYSSSSGTIVSILRNPLQRSSV